VVQLQLNELSANVKYLGIHWLASDSRKQGIWTHFSQWPVCYVWVTGTQTGWWHSDSTP